MGPRKQPLTIGIWAVEIPPPSPGPAQPRISQFAAIKPAFNGPLFRSANAASKLKPDSLSSRPSPKADLK